MANTRFFFTPESSHYPGANFPQFLYAGTATTVRRPVLAYDAATDETAYWTGVAPQGLTGSISITIGYEMVSATSGTCVWQVGIEAITDGDTTPNMATASSFGTLALGTVVVPGTAGVYDTCAITLEDTDGLAAADYFRVSIGRNADDTSDSATGDAYLLVAEMRDGV